MKEIVIKINDVTYQKFHDTVDELCAKGIGNGCFQDYTVLSTVVDCLDQIEVALQESERK